ncbi:thylakoid membrane protein TERC, chloroplastic isoform X1 [Nicotiana tabacum]|uniref:Thylakoid membrane protein TERC, chloroplastic isoform X1 n=1 Tax=Nicotiana tabacum TaxID=4097 RepID=A0A1S3XSU0_TOBAC|nr:PREDICTED: thylakoid membrane protein TERC, chloroplastic-like isoform X1 [Nicotiana tabacum]
MKLAPALLYNNTTQFPPKFISSSFRISPISSPATYPKWVHFKLAPLRSPPPNLVGCNCKRRYSVAISCLRKSEQGEESSTAEETSSSQSHNVTNNVERSHNTSAVDEAEERTQGSDNYVSSVRTVALCVLSAMAFGVGVGFTDGVGKASEFFAGYLLEQSLSVDNLFVFVLIFKYFKVPLMYQNRVLSYGIAGAIIFRLSIILLGTATLQKFEAVNLLLAGILLYSSFKLFTGEEEDADLSDNFIVKTCQKFIPITSEYDGNRFLTLQDGVWKATPLLLTVAVVELSDIAFAVDSIPAVFGVTRDPFIVFTSNLFAILGLRSLYTLISESMAELEYLQPCIGVVLGFIGFKMILDFFGYHVSTEASLGVVATCLSAGVLLSLAKKSD